MFLISSADLDFGRIMLLNSLGFLMLAVLDTGEVNLSKRCVLTVSGTN